jgi:cell division protein FtsI (penicillin-binding protein 3)
MRLKIIHIIFLGALILILLRLSYWQIARADDLSAMAESQRTTSQEIIAPRGTILFSDSSVLAGSQPAYLLYGDPREIEQKFTGDDKTIQTSMMANYKKTFADTLSQSLSQDLSPLEATDEAAKKQYADNLDQFILSQINKDLYWVNLGNVVNLDKKTQLAKLNLNGLGFEQTTRRFYPEGSSSAHLLGFVGQNEYGDQKGYFGIEGKYDGELKGKNGVLKQEKDANGLPILIGNYVSKDAKPGKTLVLNIDRTIQKIVEEKLQIGMHKYGAKDASAIVMDPKTGAILAMASLPSYDPESPSLYPKENFKNPITVDSYEPGSTFKVLVMAAAINEGLLSRTTLCDICSGPVSIGGFTIHTWDNNYHPDETMDDVIIHSDNVGMVFVSRKLGLDREFDYINKFGFGKLTGIDVQDEFSPDIRSKDSWHDVDIATASFGQGISATALQMVRAVAVLANGGKLMEPHIVKQVQSSDGNSNIDPKVVGQPISPEAAKQVTQMMVRAVNEGEAKFAKTKGYDVAGKTGTAQIPIAGHYDPTKTIASFVGFAPADNPRFVMLVRYGQPTSSIYGAETAAPTFFQIAQEIFNYYGIAPSGQ